MSLILDLTAIFFVLLGIPKEDSVWILYALVSILCIGLGAIIDRLDTIIKMNKNKEQ